MPVTFYLHDLCFINADTKHAWPTDFAGFITEIEAEPSERSHLAVFADWLKENGEPWMERAARFIVKRPEIEFGLGANYDWNKDVWEFKNESMPKGWTYIETAGCKSFAGLLASLAREMKKRAEELSIELNG